LDGADFYQLFVNCGPIGIGGCQQKDPWQADE
jgi:hypothetical protein